MSGLKESIEEILILSDEIERAFSDPLGEAGIYAYSVKEQKRKESVKDTSSDSFNCHSCPLWEKRTQALFYFNPRKADVLSVVAFLESSEGILRNDANEMYEKQMEAIGLARSERALVSLLKCPSDAFIKDYADQCRKYLKEDMASISPRIMILFGMDLAHYILNTERPYDDIRAAKRSFRVNGITTFVTYSQRECIRNPSLKRSVWEDLKAIRQALA